MKKILTLLFVFLVLTAVTYSNIQKNDEETFQPKYYDNAKVIRVKYTNGETYVRRSYEEGLEEASVNLPLFEKDVLGTTEGRLEVYLGRLNYLRLDFDSELEFERIPALRKTNLAIRIKRGGIYLDIASMDHEKDIEIQTPDCGVFVLDRGVYRINVNEAGGTTIFVHEGTAEISGKNYSKNIRDNQKIVMLAGDINERPYYFYSSDKDDFDTWNEERNRAVGYARHSSSRYLQDGYEDYEYELTRAGSWRYNSSFGRYVWIPYNIDSYWRPYYHGRWIWHPYYGYMWNSYDTWGWFTHYYGRWHWDVAFGWHWIPGYHWSPAWVYWWGSDYYYGWCPLSYWNRPLIFRNGYWHRRYDFRRHGFPHNSRSTIIVRKRHLTAGKIHKVAIRGGANVNLAREKVIFKGSSPKFRPAITKVKVTNAKRQTVYYKKEGLNSLTRYKRSAKAAEYSYKGRKITPKTTSKYSPSGKYRVGSTRYKVPKASSKSSVKYKSYGTRKIPKSIKYKSSSTKKSSKKSSTPATKGKKIKKKKEDTPAYLSSRRYSSTSKSTTSKTSQGYVSQYKNSANKAIPANNPENTTYRNYYPRRHSSSSYGRRSYGSSTSGRYGSSYGYYKSRGSNYSSYRSYTGRRSPYSRSYSRPSYRSSQSSRSRSYTRSSSRSYRGSSYSRSSRSSSSRGYSRSSSSRTSSRSSSSRSSRSSGKRK
jgi:hypothetical protein